MGDAEELERITVESGISTTPEPLPRQALEESGEWEQLRVQRDQQRWLQIAYSPENKSRPAPYEPPESGDGYQLEQVSNSSARRFPHWQASKSPTRFRLP